ncbi:MAG: PD-(D/E)XK nuclease family protein [Methanosarcina sp.]
MTKIFPPKKLSHTTCEIIDGCSLRYLFENRMRLERERLIPNYGLGGKLLHSAISGSIRRMKREDLETIKNPHDFIEKAVMTVLEDPKDPRMRSDNLMCLKNYIDFMTRRYEHCADSGNFSPFLPIYNEHKLDAVINGVPFTGTLDAVYLDNTVRLIDWKTDKLDVDANLKAKIKAEHLRQLARYGMLYNEVYDKPLFEYNLINLRLKVSLPDTREIITPKMIEEQKYNLPRYWEIANGDIFGKNPHSGACWLCDHRMRCRLHPDVIDLKYYDPKLYDPKLNTPK